MSQNDRLTAQEIDDYGVEFLDVVGKKAREVAGPQIGYLQQQVANLAGRLAQTARDGMKTILDKDVPAWREINERPEFLAALGGKDEYSGVMYHDLLKRAWAANNVPVVKSYFEKAAQDMGYMPKPPAPQPRRSDNRPVQNGPRGYYRGNDPANETFVTRQQISQFYRDVSAGKYRDNAAEKQRIENLILEAGRTGHVK
jgi:hypothetical protein